MSEQVQPLDAAEQQLIHDRSVIDHLIETFHTSAGEREPIRVQSATIYEQIRREWPADLTLGTRR